MNRKLQGIVTSALMDKTRVVSVTRFKRHRKYGKYFKVTKKFKAHDANNQYQTGDQVIIEATRPLSREKRWRIIAKLESAASPRSVASVSDVSIDAADLVDESPTSTL